MNLLRLPAVAERLDVHVATVRRLIERGDLDAVRVGSVLRVSQESIDAFIERHTVGGAA